MWIVLVIVVLVIVVVVIVAPLRRGRRSEAAAGGESAELEAAREAKYREIREAELDYRTGKLSREDWRALDATLRTEAIDLLRRLDSLDSER
jgi:type II secretory pathway component PulM